MEAVATNSSKFIVTSTETINVIKIHLTDPTTGIKSERYLHLDSFQDLLAFREKTIRTKDSLFSQQSFSEKGTHFDLEPTTMRNPGSKFYPKPSAESTSICEEVDDVISFIGREERITKEFKKQLQQTHEQKQKIERDFQQLRETAKQVQEKEGKMRIQLEQQRRNRTQDQHQSLINIQRVRDQQQRIIDEQINTINHSWEEKYQRLYQKYQDAHHQNCRLKNSNHGMFQAYRQ